MMSNKVLECLNKTLQDLCENDLFLGGKMFILAGDWKQTLPIVPHSTKTKVLANTLRIMSKSRIIYLILIYFDTLLVFTHPQWPSFIKLKLTIHMRAILSICFFFFLFFLWDHDS